MVSREQSRHNSPTSTSRKNSQSFENNQTESRSRFQTAKRMFLLIVLLWFIGNSQQPPSIKETGKGPDADEKGETAIEFNFSNARRSL